MTSTDTELYDACVTYMKRSFGERRGKIRHLMRTLHWMLLLDPSADLAMRIAAVTHDIDHATKSPSSSDILDKKHLAKHQRRGAEIMAEFLKTHKANKRVIDQVFDLIDHHETGGTAKQNVLQAADSLSFLEVQAPHFIKDYLPEHGKEKTRKKFDWMYERIQIAAARKLGAPLYEEAIKRVDAAK